MKPGRAVGRLLDNVYGTVRCRHKLGRARMLFSYLGYKLTGLFGGSAQSSIGSIRMNTPDYPLFVQLFEEIFIRRGYFFETKNPTPRILDCGGNMGMSVAYFKTLYPKARIEVFEPDPDSSKLLESNLQLNNWTDSKAYPFAVSRDDGELTFFRVKKVVGGIWNSMHVQRVINHPWEEIKVKAVRLSSYIDGPVDMLKLDVEGAEMGVLQDLDASGKMRQIEAMLIEYHHHVDKQVDELSAFLSLLEKNGFGYQLAASLKLPTYGKRFQDLTIVAYRK